MWRRGKEAITSSYKRAAGAWRDRNVKISKDDHGEKSPSVANLGWSSSAANISACRYLSPKENSYDVGRFMLMCGHGKSMGVLNASSLLVALCHRAFMSDVGLPKQSEIEGKNDYEDDDFETEGGSCCDDFGSEEVDELDHVEFGSSPTKGDRKSVFSKELLWNRIARVKIACPEDVMPVIHKWREQGKELQKWFIISYITKLRKRARYKHALKICEWLISEKPFELNAWDHVFHIDLTAKGSHIIAAKNLFDELPSEFKTSLAYSTLLMNYGRFGKIKEAELTFEEMKKLGFVTTMFPVNQLIRLYDFKGVKEKVYPLVDHAKSLGIQPDIFTYNLLLSVEAKSGNIEAVEKILDELNANSEVQPDAKTHGIVASAYIAASLPDKAEVALKQMETGNYAKTPAMYNALLKMYGRLKKAEEVERIWQLTKKLPRRSDYSIVCLLRAFSNLDSTEGAEQAFQDMEEVITGNERPSPPSLRSLRTLCSIYEKFQLNEKAEELRKELDKSNGGLDGETLHNTIEELLKSDDLEKAVDELKLNGKRSQRKPLLETYLLILEKLAEKGDVKTSERVFEACRASRYSKSIKVWNALLKAYIKADMHAYGFRQRMVADRVFPNPETQKLLSQLKMRFNE